MPEHHFETHSPVNLFVEISKGNVKVRCTDTSETTVVVEGRTPRRSSSSSTATRSA